MRNSILIYFEISTANGTSRSKCTTISLRNTQPSRFESIRSKDKATTVLRIEFGKEEKRIANAKVARNTNATQIIRIVKNSPRQENEK